MKTFLLDTNIVSPLLDNEHCNNPAVSKFIESIDYRKDHLYISPVVLAEIRFGYEICFKADEKRKKNILKELRQFPVMDINKHTVPHYTDVRSALFKKYGKAEIKKGFSKIKEKVPEDLIDKSTGKSLGIEENDLWIVACALQHNMSFVTSDKMHRLKDIVKNELNLPLEWLVWKKD